MTFNDLIGRPEYRQGDVFESPDGDLMIEVELLITPDVCWVCGRSVPAETQLYRQQKRTRHFHDTTVNGKRKLIKLVHERWRCRHPDYQDHGMPLSTIIEAVRDRLP